MPKTVTTFCAEGSIGWYGFGIWSVGLDMGRRPEAVAELKSNEFFIFFYWIPIGLQAKCYHIRCEVVTVKPVFRNHSQVTRTTQVRSPRAEVTTAKRENCYRGTVDRLRIFRPKT